MRRYSATAAVVVAFALFVGCSNGEGSDSTPPDSAAAEPAAVEPAVTDSATADSAVTDTSVAPPRVPADIQAHIEAHADLIRLESPEPLAVVHSPLGVTGRARGAWYFEASFPVVLVNWDGLIIGEGVATAEGEWMTEEFVPFRATLEFATPEYGERGTLILQKHNASGLPEHDDALEVPIRFEVD